MMTMTTMMIGLIVFGIHLIVTSVGREIMLRSSASRYALKTWGKVNADISVEAFDKLYERVREHLAARERQVDPLDDR